MTQYSADDCKEGIYALLLLHFGNADAIMSLLIITVSEEWV